MYVGVLRLRIKVLDALTLKDKRQVVKSVLNRVKKRLEFAVAEVGDEDIINLSTLGFSCVSNSYSHTQLRLRTLVDFLEDDFRIEIIEMEDKIY